MCVPSSVMDGMNGVYLCVKKNLWPTAYTNQHQTTHSSMSRDDIMNLANEVNTGDIRVDIKGIDNTIAEQNPIFLLLCQWMRRCVPLTGSALTLNPKPYAYSSKTTYENIECAVNKMTGGIRGGIRRAYLAPANVFHRNAQGPLAKVLLVGMHVQLTMGRFLMRSVRRSYTYQHQPLELHNSFLLGMKNLLLQPISFMALSVETSYNLANRI